MNTTDEAFAHILNWAKEGGFSLPETSDPRKRIELFTEIIARLRLQHIPLIEPDKEAIRLLVLEFHEKHPDPKWDHEDENVRIGTILETMITEAAERIVKSRENLPHTGCSDNPTKNEDPWE